MPNNEEIFNKFIELREQLLKICAPSTNPDTYGDLINVLNQVQKNLEVSLLQNE